MTGRGGYRETVVTGPGWIEVHRQRRHPLTDGATRGGSSAGSEWVGRGGDRPPLCEWDECFQDEHRDKVSDAAAQEAEREDTPSRREGGEGWGRKAPHATAGVHPMATCNVQLQRAIVASCCPPAATNPSVKVCLSSLSLLATDICVSVAGSVRRPIRTARARGTLPTEHP